MAIAVSGSFGDVNPTTASLQHNAGPCWAMQDHAGPCRAMQDLAGPCRTLQDRAGLCRTMQGHAYAAAAADFTIPKKGKKKRHQKKRIDIVLAFCRWEELMKEKDFKM